MLKLKLLAVVAGAVLALPAMAADVTYRKDIAPMLHTYCAECHSDKAGAPTLSEFDADPVRKEQYKKDKLGPRSDTYETLLQIIAYPDTGAFMRRLDDGTSPLAGGKPGNMYNKLCEKGADAECAANLKIIKAWVGEGAWNLNRWAKRGDVPGITKDQMDKFQLKY